MNFLCRAGTHRLDFLCREVHLRKAILEARMFDLLFVAIGIAGFAVCLGYVRLCEFL